MRYALVAFGVLTVAVVLAGCGAQDKVIGEGPASLVFVNEGTNTIEVQVRWTDHDGADRRRGFDLDPWGKVEVRLADQLQYRIALDAQCSSSAQAPASAPAPQVITVGGSAP